MASDQQFHAVTNWRADAPVLTGRAVLLREPTAADGPALVALLSLRDATRFGLDEAVSEFSVKRLIDRAAQERANGQTLTLAITIAATRMVVGLLQIRPLDPAFEAGEWECTLTPTARGSGVFIEAARLAGSFAFGSMGAHRLEARVLLENGRGNGALRKLGAVQEGILRRSARRAGEYVDQVLWSMLREDWGGHWVAAGPRVH